MEGQPPGSQASGPCSEKVSAHFETSHHNSLIVTVSVRMAKIVTVAIVVSIVVILVERRFPLPDWWIVGKEGI